MRGTGIFTTKLALAAPLVFAADYFPLQPGNQWAYRCSGAACGEGTVVVEVLQEEEVAGRRYAVLRSFRGALAWLRQDHEGTVWALDRNSGSEQVWYRFGASQGERYPTALDPCSPVAVIASQNAGYDGPAGRFSNVLRIFYPPALCSDAGLTEEYFLPGTGLLRRTEVTIAGPRSYDLIYARTRGGTVLAGPHLRFGLAVDRPVYIVNRMPPADPEDAVPRMTVRITLRNTTDEPVRLRFPTSQRYDLEIQDAEGKHVWRWSEERAFLMVYGEEEFGPGERNYIETVRLAGPDGQPLPEGRYVLRAWLATDTPQGWSASVEFEVRHVY
ncbi:MAG TPA: BsuPI-related putative proteinase inhibitor [Bryobacteraceae bacterium]|nr:BsuPI-related putative proteinase inhibitor [Bryobacteraceae bacterium]